jgi:ketosteroid isomerase-like protein
VTSGIEHPSMPSGDVVLVRWEMKADLTAGGVCKQLDNVCLAVWARTDDGWKLLAYQPTVKPAA